MGVLVDTNIHLRSVQTGHPQHTTAVAAIQRLRNEGHDLFVATQNIVEFWAVSTRPVANNGLGSTILLADSDVRRMLLSFDRLPDPPDVFDLWRDLVLRYGVSGKPTHDARLVATMLANGIDRILTFNAADFARYDEIRVETP